MFLKVGENYYFGDLFVHIYLHRGDSAQKAYQVCILCNTI